MSLLGFTLQDIRMTVSFFKMNLCERYLGSILGIYWAAVNPLLMLCIYTFVFGFIFKAKAPGSDKSLSYVIWLISGLGPWFGISEGITNGSNAVVTQAAIVKNIVFKTEILPISASLMGLVPLSVSSLFLFILIPFGGEKYTWDVLWLLLIIPLQFAFIVGVSFFVSAITVFIRDMSQLITSILLLFMFFTPIFYSFEMMPRIIQKVTFFNPFYQIVDGYRCCVLYHSAPEWKGVLYLAAISTFLWLAGLRFFGRLKGYFESCL